MIRSQTITSQGILQSEISTPRPMSRILGDVFKRVFDFVMALIGLLLLSPFFALVAVLIKRDSPGPVFFWGLRAGRQGIPFRILKFRTMYERPESYSGPRVTAKGDDRITPLGAWLRYTKINELPQLWNVLIGEMSLVGPRPEDAEIAGDWPEDAREEILSVRPGITSPASILYHDEEKMLSKNNLMGDYFKSILPDKMRLDRLYVRYHSFFSDLDIIFWTIAVLIPRLANSSIPEGYLFAGPFSRLVHRYVNWFLIDLVVALGAVGLSALLWFNQSPSTWDFYSLAAFAIILALLFSGVNSFVGLNRIMWSKATSEDGIGLVISSSIVTAAVLLVNQIRLFGWFNLSPLPISMVFTIGLVAQLGFVIVRYRLRVLSAVAGRWLSLRQNEMVLGERVLIVGSGEGGQIANWLLRRNTFQTAFSVVGMVDESDPTTHGMRVGGCWMLGGLTEMPNLVEKLDIGVILSTIPATNPKMDEYIFDFCQAYGIRLIFLDDLLRMADRQATRPLREFDYPVWLNERLEYKAVHDVITQLPNRFLFQDRLRHSLAYSQRYNTKHAVMFIELESLKSINGTLGRKYGDEVLVQVAQRLIRCKRESDTLARYGENQFALLLENIASEAETAMVARRIYNTVTESIVINNHHFPVTIQIGICQTGECYSQTDNYKNIELGTCFKHKKMFEAMN